MWCSVIYGIVDEIVSIDGEWLWWIIEFWRLVWRVTRLVQWRSPPSIQSKLLYLFLPQLSLFYLVNQQQNSFLRCGCMYYLHRCCQIHLFFIVVNDKQYWMYWPFHILYWCVYDFVKRNSILNANGIEFIMASDKTEYNVMLSRMVFIWCFFNIT